MEKHHSGVHHQRARFLGLGNNIGLNIQGLDKNNMLSYSDAMVCWKNHDRHAARERQR